MRIGLLSDTHIMQVSNGIPAQVKKIFQSTDLILHAGDIYDSWVLDDLESIAPVLAAKGDDDYGPVLADKRIKDMHNLTLAGVRLSLSHEIVSPKHIADRAWSLPMLTGEQNIKEWCGSVNHIFIFGHSHLPVIDYFDKSLLVNPGSPTQPNHRSKPGTVGLLDITPGRVEVCLVSLQESSNRTANGALKL